MCSSELWSKIRNKGEYQISEVKKENILENEKVDIQINLVSIMCDNKSRLTFRKRKSGIKINYRNQHVALSLNNLHLDCYPDDLKWAIIDEDYQWLFASLEQSGFAIESVKVRSL